MRRIGVGDRAPRSLNFNTIIDEWSASSPKVKRLSTHWVGGWVGSISVLESVAKRKKFFFAPTGNHTPVMQTVALSLYWLSYLGFWATG